MKSKLVFSLTILFAVFFNICVNAQIKNINPDPNGEPWIVGGVPDIDQTVINKINSIPSLTLNPNVYQLTLPDSVDNSKEIFMRPIKGQTLGSCSQEAGVAYTYTYEINYLRNLPANGYGYKDNWYPSYYTWNFLNGGNGGGSWYFDGWDIIIQNGCPNVPTYESIADTSYLRWMSGYDKHIKAVKNKLNSYYHIDISSIEGLKTLKYWLYVHNDANHSKGGLACFSMYLGGITEYDALPDSTENAGRSIIADWVFSEEELHSMTFVGYNDSIKYDINMDSLYTNNLDINNDSVVDMQDWEIGALIIANSHGATWPTGNDMGYAFFPYRLLAKKNYYQGSQDSIVYPVVFKQVHVLQAEENNEPELVLKLKLEHHIRRYTKSFIGYANDANQCNSVEYDTVLSYFENGGLHPLHGIDSLPVEFTVDFGYFFGDEDFGKVFYDFEDWNASGYTVPGYLYEMSLVDYRWNDTLEIFCENADTVLPRLERSTFSINYDLLPHHDDKIDSNLLLYSDMISRFEPTVSNNATLTVSDISIDMYESTIKIEDGSSLIIKDSATIHAKKGDCKIIIDGDADFGENITFKADSAASLLIVINKEDLTYTINNCTFINSAVNSYSKAPVITNCNFQNSSLFLENGYESNDTANITNNTFSDAVDSTAIAIENFNAFTVENNEIDNCLQGISLSNCDRSISVNQNIINNIIRNCSDVGINTLNSYSNIHKNLVSGCGIGIKLHNKSCTYLSGVPNTQYIEEMNRVYNCDSYELYFSKNSFPWNFHFNMISDYDNCVIPGAACAPLLYFDTENTEMYAIKNAQYNCWGDGFNPSADLYPDTLIDHLPMYCPPASPEETAIVEVQYQTNLDLMVAGEYAQSKAGFMSIIEQNPGTKYAQSAMNELIDLEEYADNDYAALKTYYQTNTTIQSDPVLAPLASKLANECDIELENYTEAVTYFEGVIADPADIQDSIYAIIDLGYLYETIASGNKASIVGEMPQYKPKSVKQFNKYKYELLSMLPVAKEAQTGTRDFGSDMYSDFTIRPNPVKSTAMLCFTLIKDGSVCFEIHNAEGVLLESLSKGYHPTGQHEIPYNASKLKPGLYYCSLVLNGEVMKTRKMVVVR